MYQHDLLNHHHDSHLLLHDGDTEPKTSFIANINYLVQELAKTSPDHLFVDVTGKYENVTKARAKIPSNTTAGVVFIRFTDGSDKYIGVYAKDNSNVYQEVLKPTLCNEVAENSTDIDAILERIKHINAYSCTGTVGTVISAPLIRNVPANNTEVAFIKTCNDNSSIVLEGASSWDTGASLALSGQGFASTSDSGAPIGYGGFTLTAKNTNGIAQLKGFPQGSLTWNEEPLATRTYVDDKVSNAVINAGTTVATNVKNDILALIPKDASKKNETDSTSGYYLPTNSSGKIISDVLLAKKYVNLVTDSEGISHDVYGGHINTPSDYGFLKLSVGDEANNGAEIILGGQKYGTSSGTNLTSNGAFAIKAASTGVTGSPSVLKGTPSGSLTWKGNELATQNYVTDLVDTAVNNVSKFPFIPITGTRNNSSVSGPIVASTGNNVPLIKANSDTSSIFVYGGTSAATGASFALRGADYSADSDLAGSFSIAAKDSTNTAKLIGYPDGTLTWNNKQVLTTASTISTDKISGLNTLVNTSIINNIVLTTYEKNTHYKLEGIWGSDNTSDNNYFALTDSLNNSRKFKTTATPIENAYINNNSTPYQTLTNNSSIDLKGYTFGNLRVLHGYVKFATLAYLMSEALAVVKIVFYNTLAFPTASSYTVTATCNDPDFVVTATNRYDSSVSNTGRGMYLAIRYIGGNDTVAVKASPTVNFTVIGELNN